VVEIPIEVSVGECKRKGGGIGTLFTFDIKPTAKICRGITYEFKKSSKWKKFKNVKGKKTKLPDCKTEFGKSKLSLLVSGKTGVVVSGKASTGIELYPDLGKFEGIKIELECGAWAVGEVCLEFKGSIKGTLTNTP